MTPAMYFSIPGAVSTSWRYCLLVSSVDSTPMPASRLAAVFTLSSAARMPLPSTARSRMVCASSCSCMPSTLQSLGSPGCFLVLEMVDGLDVPHRSALRPHDDGMGDGPVRGEPYSPEERARGHPSRGEHDIIAFCQVISGEFFVQIGDAHLLRTRLLLLVAEMEPALDLPAERLEPGSRDDALRRVPDAHEHVHCGVRQGRRQPSGDVTVPDELDARPACPDVPDELAVPVPVQDNNSDVVRFLVEPVRVRVDVLFPRRGEVDDACGLRADGDLVHVGVRGMEQVPLERCRENGDGVVASLGGDVGPFEGIDGDVYFRAIARADLLADVEHGRLVPLALADDHPAPDGDGGKYHAHGLDGRLVSSLVVPPPHPPRGRHGRGFCGADKIQCKVAIHLPFTPKKC